MSADAADAAGGRAKALHPSDKAFVAQDLPGQYVAGNGRLPYKVAVHSTSVEDMLRRGLLTTRFVEERLLDRATLPTRTATLPGTTPPSTTTATTHEEPELAGPAAGAGAARGAVQLDTARVLAELGRGGKHAPRLSTVVMTRRVACNLYDLGLVLAGLAGEGGGTARLSNGDFGAVRWSALVGRLVPYFTKVPNRMNEPAAFEPLGGAGGSPHAFAFKPVLLTTAGEPEDRGDQGEVMALGLVVSPRTFNYPTSQPGERLSLGAHPEFEETACYILVVHAYSTTHPFDVAAGQGAPAVEGQGVPFAAMNKPNKPRGSKRKREAHSDPWDARREPVFMWRAYEEHHADRIALKEKGYAVGSFGLLITKMTNRFGTRAVVPWSIAEVGARLRDLRGPAGGGGLERYLVELPMTHVASGTRGRDYGGLDLRCMLMAERLLLGTPLACLLEGRAPASLPFADPPVTDARTMYLLMKRHADAHFAN